MSVDLLFGIGRYMAIAAVLAIPHVLAAWLISGWLARSMRADFARLDAALQRLEQQCGAEPREAPAEPPLGSREHRQSCCGCGETTGRVSWAAASACGWRTFRVGRSEYTICPKCRRVGAPS